MTLDPMGKLKAAAQAVKTRLQIEGVLSSKVRWIPISLSPKQQFVFDSDFEELLTAGSVGSGKTALMLACALKYVDYPDYRAVIVRVNFPAIEELGGILDQLKGWLEGTAAVWNERKKEFRFPSGARIRFRPLSNKREAKAFVGGGYHFIGIDQLEQIAQPFYEYLFTRIGRKKTVIPNRVMSNANVSEEGYWLYLRFADGASKYQDKDYCLVKTHQNDLGWEWTSHYVDTSIDDNPGLDKAEYQSFLSRLSYFKRRQLVDNDWKIRDRGDVYPFEEPYTVITWTQFKRFFRIDRKEPDRPPSDWTFGMGVDWGASDTHLTALSYIAIPPRGKQLSDSIFIWLEKTFLKPVERDVAEWMKANEPADVARRIRRYISHDAATEMRTFQKEYELVFSNPKLGTKAGISVVRDHLTIIDLNQVHPFHHELTGRPRMYVVVADGQGEIFRNEYAQKLNPFDLYVSQPPIDEKGMPEHRRSLRTYRWKGDEPDKTGDDTNDACRFICVQMSPIKDILPRDPRGQDLPEPLQLEAIRSARPQDVYELALRRKTELVIMDRVRAKLTKPEFPIPVYRRKLF